MGCRLKAEDVRPQRERPRNGHALLLRPPKAGGGSGHAALQAHPGEQLNGVVFNLLMDGGAPVSSVIAAREQLLASMTFSSELLGTG